MFVLSCYKKMIKTYSFDLLIILHASYLNGITMLIRRLKD
jgi:hypothetical protein